MKNIILIGGGGHCKSVIDVIEKEGRFIIAGIVDVPELLGTDVLGYPVIGDDSDIENLSNKYTHALITIGQIRSPEIRVKLFNLVKKVGFICPTIISPRAYVSKHSITGAGTVIMHDALVNTGVYIGKNCIINSKALIEHDSKISDHCHISTNAIVNGGVTIKSGCFLGSGSITNNLITIEENSFFKAGVIIK